MSLDSDVAVVVALCRTRLELGPHVRLGREYFYASLPLCVIDAVFSINARYATVENVVRRVCERLDIPRCATEDGVPPERRAQLSTTGFISRIDSMGGDDLTTSLFGNRQRTSTRNGILKAEAVLHFAEALRRGGVEHLQDTVGLGEREDVEADVRRIPGQASGLSWRYFLMLVGDDTRVKPDRMIRRFLTRALGREPRVEHAQTILERAAAELRADCPALTPRLLDHLIWRAERAGE